MENIGTDLDIKNVRIVRQTGPTAPVSWGPTKREVLRSAHHLHRLMSESDNMTQVS